jgi:hypothetical protein
MNGGQVGVYLLLPHMGLLAQLVLIDLNVLLEFIDLNPLLLQTGCLLTILLF